jgi:hypothetical protein
MIEGVARKEVIPPQNDEKRLERLEAHGSQQ